MLLTSAEGRKVGNAAAGAAAAAVVEMFRFILDDTSSVSAFDLVRSYRVLLSSIQGVRNSVLYTG